MENLCCVKSCDFIIKSIDNQITLGNSIQNAQKYEPQKLFIVVYGKNL